MSKKELREKVVTEIKAMLREDDEIFIDTVDVIKLNDMHLTGILFKRGDFGATFYLEDFSDETKSPSEIAGEMVTAYETSTDVPPVELMESIKNMQTLEDIKNNLIVTLADIEKNQNFLLTVPYKEIGNGLAIICRALHADNDGCGFMCATITKDLAGSNHWDVDKMFDFAIENTIEVNPPRLYHMADALFGRSADDLLSNADKIVADDMMVLTNDSGMYGAVALFLPGVAENLLDRIQQPFFAIPSSQHEFILLPEASGYTLPALKAMCKEANETVVALNDILSDRILYVSNNEIVSY